MALYQRFLPISNDKLEARVNKILWVDKRLERRWHIVLYTPGLLTLTLEAILVKGRDSTVVLSGRQCTSQLGSFLLRRCSKTKYSTSADVAGSSSAAACDKRSASIASYMY